MDVFASAAANASAASLAFALASLAFALASSYFFFNSLTSGFPKPNAPFNESRIPPFSSATGCCSLSFILLYEKLYYKNDYTNKLIHSLTNDHLEQLKTS